MDYFATDVCCVPCAGGNKIAESLADRYAPLLEVEKLCGKVQCIHTWKVILQQFEVKSLGLGGDQLAFRIPAEIF